MGAGGQAARRQARPDLIEGLLQACWLLERAREHVYTSWGPEFDERAERTARRATLVEAAMDAREVARPDHVLDDHRAWLVSLVGEALDAVPLGPALTQRFGEWTNVYAVDYLVSDPAEFLALGEAELLIPVAPRTLDETEGFLPQTGLGDGARFAILNDIHVGAKGSRELLAVAVREIAELEPEFVLVAGDITDDGEPEQFAVARELLSRLPCPVHHVLGNHDAVRRSTRESVGTKLFAEAFGHPPDDVVVECGGLQVALLDSTDPTPSPFPDWDLGRGGFREDAGGVNGGALGGDQIEKLVTKLDPARPVLVVAHHELQPFSGFPPVMFAVRQTDSDALLDALAGFDLVGVVAGHTHRSALSRVGRTGVAQLEVPALKDWPYVYSVVTVNDGRPRVTVRQVGDRDLVWKGVRAIPSIFRNYALGPLRALDHAF